MNPEYAYMMYTDARWEILHISKVAEDKEFTKPFQPLDETDYDENFKYWGRSAKFPKANLKPSKCKGYVCRLAATRKGVEESVTKKRPRYPVLQERESDYATSTDAERNVVVQDAVRLQRSKALEKNTSNKSARDKSIQNSLKRFKSARENSDENAGMNDSVEVASESGLSVDSLPSQKDARIRVLETQLASLKRQLDQRDSIETRIGKIEEAVGLIPTLSADVKKMGSEVENLKSKLSEYNISYFDSQELFENVQQWLSGIPDGKPFN